MTSTEQRAVDLLPCPFCGGRGTSGEHMDWIACDDCGATGATADPHHPMTKAEAWNRRDALARHLAGGAQDDARLRTLMREMDERADNEDEQGNGLSASTLREFRDRAAYMLAAQPTAQSFGDFIRSSGPEKDAAMLGVIEEATEMQRATVAQPAAQEAGAVARWKIEVHEDDEGGYLHVEGADDGEWVRYEDTATPARAAGDAVPFRTMADDATLDDYLDGLCVGSLTPVDQMALDNKLHDLGVRDIAHQPAGDAEGRG
jgi:hypothetical protein